MYRLFAKIKSMFLQVATLAITIAVGLVLAFLYRRKQHELAAKTAEELQAKEEAE